MPYWFFVLIVKDRTTCVFCKYSLCFTLLHKTCGMILTVRKKNFVTYVQKLRKPFFCVLKKNACDCLYLLLCHNKITIDERLNGFIVCIVLFYDLLSI